MRLSDFTQSRDNNFNLIRIIAAYAVLVSHSFALPEKPGAADPALGLLGMTLGSMAVDVFFLTSGFLVTASLLTRQCTVEFIWARVLRIFPALLAMLLLSVFGLGLFFTSLPWPDYLADPKVYKYFAKCLTLLGGVAYELPGVFEGNPYTKAVNGSLWSMPFEVRLYAILAGLWLVFRLIPRFRAPAFKFAIVTGVILAGLALGLHQFGIIKHGGQFAKLALMFFTGGSFFIFKEKIRLSRPVFYGLLALLALAALHKPLFFFVYLATLPYLLFFAAYVPSGLIRHYNRLGDYSYGIYIYAFPVQQSAIALLPGVSVLSVVLISSGMALLFAVLSWHCLEKHALKLKARSVQHTHRLLGFRQPQPDIGGG
jgi:peptidoglycan/LPS O-acetylase OafA/YrhL